VALATKGVSVRTTAVVETCTEPVVVFTKPSCMVYGLVNVTGYLRKVVLDTAKSAPQACGARAYEISKSVLIAGDLNLHVIWDSQPPVCLDPAPVPSLLSQLLFLCPFQHVRGR
jgi:hypothetical protein